MNKYLAWLPVMMIISGSLYKPVKEAREEKPANTSISFAVYKSNSYISEAYKNTSAQVHIIVEKVTRKGTAVVWDTVLDSKKLSDYPSLAKAQYQKITIPGIDPKKEYLQVRYTLTYNSKGSELQMQDGALVSSNGTSKLNIGI